MLSRPRRRAAVAALLSACAGVVAYARSTSAITGTVAPAVSDITTPVGPDAGMYALAANAAGRAYLSWLEPSGDGLALRFSALADGRWSAPRTVVAGRHLFSNWADHPGVAVHDDGTLTAQWPVVNPGPQPAGSYANSMRIALSKDDGRTWTEVFADGLDNTLSYSGFVSLLPTPSGWRAVYLTPPRPLATDPHDHGMTLSHVTLGPDGHREAHGVVDGDTCSCCPTAVALTDAGPIAAYRDHEPGEIRDIAVVRFVDGRWSAPAVAHRDGWKINGCPTNGPALAANGRRVALAWFTAANDVARVRLSFSDDGGASFGRVVEVDGTQSIGRPAVALLPDGSAAVAWLATLGTGDGAGELRVRRAFRDGTLGPIVVAGAASPGRLSGMPQIVRVGDAVLVAWRGDRLRTVRIPLPLT